MIQAKELTEKLEMFACMQCGKCSAGCPESGKSGLNIRRIIRELTVSPLCELKQTDPLWDCTSCSACTLRCPRGLQPHELIIGLRGALIETGEIPVTARDSLEAVFKHGNPWGRAKQKREEWTEGLAIKNLSDSQAEILYYVCCAAAYDPRVQNVARSLAGIFNESGSDFGILGIEESCCGSETRRMGEAGLFEMIVEDNMKLFNSRGVKHIVATSPHCFDALKNKYNAEAITVQHYTQYVAGLLDGGKLSLTKNLDKIVAYHDPCYLGKQNDIYDEPREILKAIPGINYLEFDRRREKSLCCEGGGGRMWLEGTNTGERLAETRVKDAAEMGVDIIATACPFCLLTLEDAVKITGFEEKILIKDISELIVEAL
ncbi:MAG: (Fe-S)-binding protein [Spirochaetia bacterium]|jgi:Fe-S oxidoreductase|nr:(Fe-S)-binding protein [Spirochaetia bacterium]